MKALKNIFISKKTKKRMDIQALRALAVLSVLIFHLSPQRLIGGFTGVDIFFVLSGFLMTKTIILEINRSFQGEESTIRKCLLFFKSFYQRRIRRLLPASLILLIIVQISLLFIDNYSLRIQTSNEVKAAVSFQENILLLNKATDYFGATENASAVQHFWSLSLEEQFYFMYPLLLLIITLVFFFIFKSKNEKKLYTSTFIILILLTLASFVFNLHEVNNNSKVVYFNTFTRVFELLIGGVIFFIPKIKNKIINNIIPFIGLILCLMGILFVNENHFPGYKVLLPIIGTSLIIISNTPLFNKLSSLRPIQFLGNISYSLYLWHWPLIILLPLLTNWNDYLGYGYQWKLVIIGLSIIFATLSYYLVENKFINNHSKFFKHSSLMLIIIAILVYIGSSLVINSTYNSLNKGLGSLKDSERYSACFGARSIINDCPNKYRYNKKWVQYYHFVHGTISDPIDAEISYRGIRRVGEISSNNIIAVVGDSHMQQYAGALDLFGKNNNYKIMIANTNKKGDVKINDKWDSDTLKIMQQYKPLIYIFSCASGLERCENTILKYSELLKNDTIILIQDIPYILNDKDDCFTKKNCKTFLKDQQPHMNSTYNKVTEINNNVKFLEIKNNFCDSKGTCYSFNGGIPIYYDNTHINSMFSISLNKFFENNLLPFLKD